MEKGAFYDGIEKDPRDTLLTDTKYDLKTLPGYQGLQSQKTIKHAGLQEKAIPLRVEKYLDIMKKHCQRARDRVRERKIRLGIDPDAK